MPVPFADKSGFTHRQGCHSSSLSASTSVLESLKYVNKISEADIYVSFVKRVNCSSESAVGCTHYGVVRNGFFTQNKVEIGIYELIYNSDGSVYGTKPVTRPKNNLYGVMIHEIGHALGFEHSENKNSIMYPIDRNEIQYITKTDLNILSKKYR